MKLFKQLIGMYHGHTTLVIDSLGGMVYEHVQCSHTIHSNFTGQKQFEKPGMQDKSCISSANLS